jgi:cytochrome P450
MNNLPPGTSSGLFSMLGMMRDPYGAISRYSRKFGDPFTISGFMQGPIVVTGDPAAIRTIFAADPDIYGSSGAKVMGPILGAGSVLIVEGAAHRRARKLLNPPFHGDRMRAHARLMRDVTRERSAHLVPGVRFAVQDVAEAISLDVILQAIFGIRGTERMARFDRAVRDVMRSLGPFVAFEFLRRSFGGIGPWAKFQRRRRELVALVEEEIANRRSSGEDREDILSMLLAARYDDGSAMSDSDVFDQLLTLVAAGHETSTITIAWAFYWLHRNPDVLERLLAEIDALDGDPEPAALAKLPYLEAVVQETLRLYPIVAIATRLLRQPFELKGHQLPPGVIVGVATSLVHYREDLYPEPEQFRPERFLGKSFGPAEYFPFGGGARRCLGAAFAMYEIKIVLATLLRTIRVRPVDDKPVRPALRAAGIGPGRGVSMMVTERRLIGLEQSAHHSRS